MRWWRGGTLRALIARAGVTVEEFLRVLAE
jgi:hypothetical protein